MYTTTALREAGAASSKSSTGELESEEAKSRRKEPMAFMTACVVV
jgi:hypothetical protein